MANQTNLVTKLIYYFMYVLIAAGSAMICYTLYKIRLAEDGNNLFRIVALFVYSMLIYNSAILIRNYKYWTARGK